MKRRVECELTENRAFRIRIYSFSPRIERMDGDYVMYVIPYLLQLVTSDEDKTKFTTNSVKWP